MSEPVNLNNRKRSYNDLDERFATTVKANEQMKPCRGARPDEESDLILVLPDCSVTSLDDEGSQKIVAELDGVATEENENAAIDNSPELEIKVTYPPVAKGRPDAVLQVELNLTDSLQAEGRCKTQSQSRNEAAKMKIEALLHTKVPGAHDKANQPKLESWGSAEKKKENATRRQWTTVTFPAQDSGFKLNINALFALIVLQSLQKGKVIFSKGIQRMIPFLIICCLVLILLPVANSTLVEVPRNAVVLEGESSKTVDLTCKSDSQYLLKWFMKKNHDSEREELYSGYSMHPDAKSYCTVITDKEGKYNPRLNNTPKAAQTYICLEPGTLNEASADLIWLSKLVCNDSSTEDLVNLTCSIEFRGNWAPIMEWKEHSSYGEIVLSNRISNDTVPNQFVTSTLVMARKNSTRSYLCTTKFDISGKPRNTTATNVPDSNLVWMTSVLSKSQAFGDVGLVLSEEHTEQVAAKLGTCVTLQSFSCTGDDWYYKGPNKTEAEIMICVGMVCRNGWEEEVINNTCNLDFNFTEKNAGIYRNKEYNKDISKSYNVSGTLKDEQGRVNITGYTDNWTYPFDATKILLVVLGFILIIIILSYKCCKSRRDGNGIQQDQGHFLQHLYDPAIGPVV